MIADWLAHHARTRGDHLAVRDLGTDRALTYREFHARVTRLAGALRDGCGVQAGDRVMVVARNSTDVYELMFASWRLGAVFMPVNWRLAPPELAAIVAHGEPTVIVADEEFVSGLPRPCPTVVTRHPGRADSDYEQRIASSAPVFAFAPATLETVNTLLYTSGTTGQPKGVIGTWRMTTLMLLQAGPSGHLTPDSVTLTAAPQFHTAGLNSFATPLFHLGGTLAVMSSWNPEACLRHLADPTLGITHTLGVPTQYLLMTRRPEFSTLRFPTLRMAAVGGAPPTTDLMDACAAHGLPLTPGYGMTEVFGVAQITADVARRKPGAVGWPALYTDIRIADDEQRVLGAGATGEIQIRSAGVTPGYWRDPEATTAAFIDGWFRTGDLGYMDDEGLLYLVDRKKDMFISGGENVYPVEIENVLTSFPEVLQAAVVGLPDTTWGQVGHAVVVRRPGVDAEPANLLARCRTHLAAYKVPKTLVFVEALPMNAQGKVLKDTLRAHRGH